MSPDGGTCRRISLESEVQRSPTRKLPRILGPYHAQRGVAAFRLHFLRSNSCVPRSRRAHMMRD